jgi:transcriptional regulator with XRE-family HTH domain
VLANEQATRGAELPPVGDKEKELRGAAIRHRRLELGLNGYREFAEATGRDKGTLGRVERGTAAKETYESIEMWLDREEAVRDGTAVIEASEPIRVEMHGVYGIQEVIVTGPVDHPDELAEAVGLILERIRQSEKP